MTMHTLRVHDVLKNKILVSRESARLLEDPLRTIVENARTTGNESGTTPVTVDFAGVEGIAPSFLDELVTVFESVVGAKTTDNAGGLDGCERRLIVANPPTRLSLKFEAVARGHGMSVRALPDGSWLLTDDRDGAT